MASGGTTRAAVAAAGIAAMLMLNAAPAEAGPRGWRGALAAGIIGSFAVGMMAAAADAQAEQHAATYVALPKEETLEASTIRLPLHRVTPARLTRTDPRSSSTLTTSSPQVSSAVLKACRDYLTSASRPHGSVRVVADAAGPLVRNRSGIMAAPITARIKYSRAGRSQVRAARVTCHVDQDGRAVAIRSLRTGRHAAARR
jgi:hypothetical protein